jgi:phosphonate transport system substrate-binding protein
MTSIRHRLIQPALMLYLLSAAIAHAGPGSDRQADEHLELAVAPFLPAATLVSNYQPMRAYLEQRLKEPVLFVTAPDYKTFYERAQRREYPVIITVANAAYLAYAESGYVPMLRPVIYTRPVIVVPKLASWTRIQDLRGKTIALPDTLAVVAMQGTQMLRELGLDPDKDVTLKYLPNHSAAVNHVISGEAAAAIVSDRALLQMPAATQAGVRVIETWEKGAVPGVVYLANPALSPQRVTQLTQAILKFVHDTPQGHEFIKKMGYGDLTTAIPQDLAPLATYGGIFKATIAKKNEKATPE